MHCTNLGTSVYGVTTIGTSRLTESKVFNIIDNDQLDPEALIKEVAALPAGLSQRLMR